MAEQPKLPRQCTIWHSSAGLKVQQLFSFRHFAGMGSDDEEMVVALLEEETILLPFSPTANI
jgi:hypothetical protein